MKVSYVEWPNGLMPNSPEFNAIKEQVHLASPDILITNEMPFGRWVSSFPAFDIDLAIESVALHEKGLVALTSLNVPLIISSRPVRSGDRLANEAFALQGDHYTFLHHKHFFPAHVGWYEAEWFNTGIAGFELAQLSGISIGVLLCTELMFNEHARAYGRAGADLIIVPRASGPQVDRWKIACSMAAYVSGSYVVTSNHSGEVPGNNIFGGVGFAFAPGGEQIGQTSVEQTLMSFDLDRNLSAAHKKLYPCYVSETIRGS
ncbi:nitrilase [Pseudomonas sp. RIT-PI-q]|uniref:carbon-nitrogen hydrolase family protein n=1 Tax=Pseudomonas sp. RIT-PI-q TaxID=1690247 RepID=UPI0006CD21C5|nr:carbon-nitrogen hydrolase family protein [Pseudomonas sp. RIT-PI-q]KPG95995.1 nitrilase [Pseudomonas sp. RIT-PI-q]